MNAMRVFSRIVPAALAIVVASLFSASPLTAQRQALATHVAAARDAKMVGRVPATQQFRLALTLQLHNPDQLQSFLADVNDPKSPNYRRFLSVADFTERYGPTADDYQKAIAFAKSNGLAVVNTTPNRLVLDVSGTAAQIEQAFGVRMNLYQHPTESRTYYAPNVEPSIAAGVPIQGVNGLNTFMPPRPMGLERQNVRAVTKGEFANGAQITRSNQTGSGPDGFFLGSDMRAAYYGGSALTGAGQAVGLFEFGPYNMSDVQAYFSFISQPLNVPIVNVLLDGVNGVCGAGCDDGEEVIDIQQAVSMAPGLSAIIVYEGNDDTDMFNQMATDNIAKSLSCSFGFLPPDPSSDQPIFEEFAAQGQNLFVASGDGGAYFGDPTDCANFSNLNGCIFYPADDPLITAAGGTDLVTSSPGGPWQSETGWIGSGGGFSTNNLAIPSYQVPVITSTNQGSTTLRNIPDVAAEANTDNFFCANGGCFIGVGGTSLSAPRWAGFIALANQQSNGPAIGFLNPTIYSIGQSSNYATDLHDITVGNDFNGGSPTLFSDETGFDLVTGWGSPNGQGLLDALSPAFTGPNFTVTSSPSTLNVTQGSSTTSMISVTPTNGFTGTVSLSVNALGMPAGVTATISPASVTAPGSATLTVTTTGSTPGGNFQVVVSGTSGSLTQTAYVTLALPGFSITPSSTVFLNQRGKATGSLTVVPVNGFTGTVTMSISGLPRGVTAAFKPSNKIIKVGKIAFAAGTTTATGVFPLTITGTSGDITQTATLNLAVSAATGGTSEGVTVNLSSFYNVNGIYSNGRRFPSNGGLDGGGAAYSANALTPERVFDGVKYVFGPANEPNAISGGPAITLPAGNFAVLGMLATGVQGDQFNQTVTVTYTDGSTAVFTQSFSDWFTPSGFLKEESAVVMSHRNIFNGTLDNRIFTLYNYTFQLDPTKTVQSVTLPNDRNVVALAMTLTH